MDGRSWRRLLAPQRRGAPEAAALAAVGLGGLALGTAVLFVIGAEEPPLPFVVGLCTAVLSLLVAWLVLPRAIRPSDLTLPVLFWCALAGVLNTPTSLFASIVVLDVPLLGHAQLPGLLVAATVFGALVAGPLGLFFGALYLVPLRRVVLERRLRSLDSGDGAAATAGAWLAFVALLALTVALLWSTAAELRSGAVHVAAAGCGVVCLAGVAASIVADSRRRRRLALLDRVRAGEVEALAVLPRATLCLEALTLPTLGASKGEEAEALDGVLVEHRPGAERGAYRSLDDLVPLAFVKLAPSSRSRAPAGSAGPAGVAGEAQ